MRRSATSSQRGNLWIALGAGLVLQVLFWGHRLPVLAAVAVGLGRLSRWLEPRVGLLLPRALFLLPAAMVVLVAPAVLHRRRGGELAVLGAAMIVAALNVVTVVVMTRGA